VIQHLALRLPISWVLSIHCHSRDEEIAELEGLFRQIYRRDTRANSLNIQRGFKKARRVGVKDLRGCYPILQKTEKCVQRWPFFFFDVMYVGMAGTGRRGGIRGRLWSHSSDDDEVTT